MFMFKMKNNSKLHFGVKYRMTMCMDENPAIPYLPVPFFYISNSKNLIFDNFRCWKRDFRASKGTIISKFSGRCPWTPLGGGLTTLPKPPSSLAPSLRSVVVTSLRSAFVLYFPINGVIFPIIGQKQRNIYWVFYEEQTQEYE